MEYLEEPEKPWWINAARYFLHGILFSIIYTVLYLFWSFIWSLLVVMGPIIWFITGFIVLFFIVGGITLYFILGGVNIYLTDRIWDIPIKEDLKSLLEHGFVLSILLFIVHIPMIAITFTAPDLARALIVLFILYAFIDGYVAKKVGQLWEEEYE